MVNVRFWLPGLDIVPASAALLFTNQMQSFNFLLKSNKIFFVHELLTPEVISRRNFYVAHIFHHHCHRQKYCKSTLYAKCFAR